MNKKLIIALFAVAVVAVLAFAACAPDIPGETPQDVLSLYDGVKNAKSATQVITVKNGTDEVAKETLNYNFETNKVEITRKTLNGSDASELYTTTTETKDITGRNTAKLTASLLKDVNKTETTLTAKVANANLNEVFGIAATSVSGDATVTLVAESSHITKITVSYTSANGNAVEIVTTYAY